MSTVRATYDVPSVSFTFQEQQDFGDTQVGSDAISAGYASASEDWIKAYRSVRSHPIVGFLNEDGTRRKGAKITCELGAWIDLCMQAGWKNRRYNNKGRVILVERGQFIGARKWLAARWGWTEEAVRWFLKKLQNEKMIEIGEGTPVEDNANPKANTANRTQQDTQPNNQRRSNQSSVITICNYNIYQTASELQNLINNQRNTASTPSAPPAHPQRAPSAPPDLKKERKERIDKRERGGGGSRRRRIRADACRQSLASGSVQLHGGCGPRICDPLFGHRRRSGIDRP